MQFSDDRQTVNRITCKLADALGSNKFKEDLLKKVKSSKNPKRKTYRSIGAVAACLLIGVGINAASLCFRHKYFFSILSDV